MKSNYWCNGQQSKAQPNMWRPLKRWMLKTKSISTYHCKVLVCHLGIREGVKSFRPGQQVRQSMCNMQRKKKHTRDKIWTQNSQSLSSYNHPYCITKSSNRTTTQHKTNFFITTVFGNIITGTESGMAITMTTNQECQSYT